MNNKKNSCMYVTYDTNLKKYLSDKGISDIIYGLHPKSNNMFWVYERDEKLNTELEKWFNKKMKE